MEVVEEEAEADEVEAVVEEETVVAVEVTPSVRIKKL